MSPDCKPGSTITHDELTTCPACAATPAVLVYDPETETWTWVAAEPVSHPVSGTR